MKSYKQSDKKKISFFILTGFFTLFLLLSFFSISNVYGVDSEVITSDINADHIDISLANNLNQNNLVLNDNLDFYNESVEDIILNESGNSENINNTLNITVPTITFPTLNSTPITSPNDDRSIAYDNYPTMDSESMLSDTPLNNKSNQDNHITNNSKNTDISYLRDTTEKIEGKAVYLDNIGFNEVYFIFNFYGSDFEWYFNDIYDYINQEIILPVSLSSKGNGFENFNNFIKKVANIEFNNIDNDEDISFIQSFQSSSNTTLTILFFIKIFMDYHNNGKEHLNSF